MTDTSDIIGPISGIAFVDGLALQIVYPKAVGSFWVYPGTNGSFEIEAAFARNLEQNAIRLITTDTVAPAIPSQSQYYARNGLANARWGNNAVVDVVNNVRQDAGIFGRNFRFELTSVRGFGQNWIEGHRVDVSYERLSLTQGRTVHLDEVKAAQHITNARYGTQVAGQVRAVAAINAQSAGMRLAGTVLKRAGIAGAAVTVVTTAINVRSKLAQDDRVGAGREIAKASGGWGGAVAGASIGAWGYAAGPVVGTLTTFVGGIAGAIAGEEAVSAFYDAVFGGSTQGSDAGRIPSNSSAGSFDQGSSSANSGIAGVAGGIDNQGDRGGGSGIGGDTVGGGAASVTGSGIGGVSSNPTGNTAGGIAGLPGSPEDGSGTAYLLGPEYSSEGRLRVYVGLPDDYRYVTVDGNVYAVSNNAGPRDVSSSQKASDARSNFLNSNNMASDADLADIPDLQGNRQFSDFKGSELNRALEDTSRFIDSVNEVGQRYVDELLSQRQAGASDTSTRLTFDDGGGNRVTSTDGWQDPAILGGGDGTGWPGGGSGWLGGGSGWPGSNPGGGGSGWPGTNPGGGGTGWPGGSPGWSPGGWSPGGGSSGGGWSPGGGYPVVLDLTGQGIHVTQRASSNHYFDMAGDGYQHATAWAGAGNGVLVLDLNGNGIIDQADQVNFTLWDPTATSDMQALLDVFDTNHDGKLDSGDAEWSKFKVMVTNADGTTQLQTLDQLGITSINLTTNNQKLQLADGSSIDGTTTYSKSDGTTGTAADVTFAYDADGYVVARTTTVNADGSTTIDNKAFSSGGSLARETISTTSADGKSVIVRRDSDGDGVIDSTETDNTLRNADGSTTLSVTNFQGTSTRVTSRTVTTTSADLKTITIGRDSAGSGVFDQFETDVWNASGSLTVSISNLNPDGSVNERSVATTSADGLSKTTQIDSTGSGVFDLTETDVTALGADGSRTKTVTDRNGDGSLRQQIVTLTSSDHLTKTRQVDADGNGTVDLTQIEAIVVSADRSTVSTQKELNGNGSLRDEVVTMQSADGLSKTIQSDVDGNGSFDSTATDVTVVHSDYSRTETVIVRNTDGSLRSEAVTTRSQDGKTRTIQADSNGDGAWDAVETVAPNANGASVDTASLYNHDGSLRSRTVTTTSADGLSVTTQADADGDGSVDRTRTDVTVLNADGSSTETITDLSGNGTMLDRTVVTTRDGGLSKTIKVDPTGSGSFVLSKSDITVLNSDGSNTETVTFTNGDGSLRARSVTIVSSDRRTTTAQVDTDGDGHVDQVVSTILNADGSVTTTAADYAPIGALLDKTVKTTSANGLSVTTQQDTTGSGTFDLTRTDVTVLNPDGSKTETISDVSADGALLDKTVVMTSANGLSVTTQQDSTGSGSFDHRRTDVIALNADGSTTETISDFSANGTLLGDVVVTKSANGLSVTTQRDNTGSGKFDQTRTDVTVLNADGGKTETVSDFSSNGTLLDKTVVTASADGSTVTSSLDANGDGKWDSVETVALNANGTSVDTASLYNHDGSLQSRTVKTTSADGLSVTTQADVNGDGSIDRTHTDVTVRNADGSSTETITDLSGNGTMLDRTVVTISASGLSKTTQSDPTGAGSYLVTETDVTLLNADGSSTETVTDTHGNGSLAAKAVTTVSADRRTITKQVDTDGDGHVDQVVSSFLNADGSVTAAAADYAATGALLDRTVKTTSANGLSVTTQQDTTGAGTFDRTRTDVTVLNPDGSKTETTSDVSANGTLRDKTVVTTSASGLSVTTQQDRTGSGSFDHRRTDVIALNADGSTTEIVSDFSGNGTLLDDVVVTKSANGLSVTTQRDNTGSGRFDQTRTDVTVLNADGGKTETVSDFSSNGTLLDKTVVTTSGDRGTVTTSVDSNGDGVVDRAEVDAIAANGALVKTFSDYAANGALKDRLTVTTSASGLSVTSQYDNNGDGFIDKTKTDVTVLNADGTRTETISDLSASGGLMDRVVITTSANGLSKTTQEDLASSGSFSLTESDVTVLGADGSKVETVTDTNGNGSLRSRTVTSLSGDGRTRTVSRDSDGNGIVDQSVTTVINADGSTVSTVTDFNANGSVKDKAVVTTSANGLSVTTQRDTTGSGFDETTTGVTVLNADGSKTETTSDFSGATLKDRIVVSTSANGLSKTTQWDLNGDGAIDETQTSITVLNADGSQVKTTSIYNSSALERRFVETTSGNGLSKTTQWVSGSGAVTQMLTDSTVVNPDGSSTETVTAAGQSKIVTTTSADGQRQVITYDSNADGFVDKTRTILSVTGADGSITETVSDTDGNGNLIDRSTQTASADHRTVTTYRDVDGDGIIDQSESDTVAVDGSKRQYVTDLSPSGAVLDRTIVDTSADGLTTTTYWEFTGSGAVDRTRTDTIVKNADGSTTETVIDRNSDGSLYQQGITSTSADGRTKTLQEQTHGKSYFDHTEVTTVNADGSSTTVTKNLTSTGTLVDQTITTVSADGLTRRIAEDTTGSSNFNYHAVTAKLIDGSTVTDATTTDPSTHANKRVVTTVSADGLTKTIQTDSTSAGWFDSVETDVTRIDGSVVATTFALNSAGQVISKTVAETNASGAEKAARTTNYQDGTTTLSMWASDGTQSWTYLSNTYNSSGTLTSQSGTDANGYSWTTLYNQDGTTTINIAAPDGAQSWTHLSNKYNSGGALISQAGTYANGKSWTTLYDAAGAQPWTLQSGDYNAAGKLISVYTLKDNGTATRVFYDPDNVTDWTTVTNEYDAQGTLASQRGTYDNGQSWLNAYAVPVNDGGVEYQSTTYVGAPQYEIFGVVTAKGGSTWSAGTSWTGYVKNDNAGTYVYTWVGSIDPASYLQELGTVYDYLAGRIYNAPDWILPTSVSFSLPTNVALPPSSSSLGVLAAAATAADASGPTIRGKTVIYTGQNATIDLANQVAQIVGLGTVSLPGVTGAVVAGSGNTLVASNNETLEITIGSGNRLIATGSGNVLKSDSGANTLFSNAGGNTLVDGANQASANYALNNATVDLSTGKVQIAGSNTYDTLTGVNRVSVSGDGNVLIAANNQTLQVTSGHGNTLVAEGGGDTLIGGSGQDEFVLAPGAGNVGIDHFQTGKHGDTLDLGSTASLKVIETDYLLTSDFIGAALPSDGWIPAGSGDFNGDGKDDLIWHGSDGETGAWSVSGSSIQSITLPKVGWDLVGVADFNGDGHDDLLFKGGNSGNYSIAYMNGSTQIGGVSYSNGWNFAGIGDFNGDGKTDVLMTDGHGNYGAISANGSSIGGYNLPSNGWSLIGIGDFNGDKTSDLIMREGPNSGDTWINLVSGSASVGSIHLGNTSGSIVAVGDFDHDGRDDILWSDGLGHYSITFLAASGPHTVSEGSVGTEWSVAGTGDYNGDGRTDILWHNAKTTQNAVWYMNGASYAGQQFGQYASEARTYIENTDFIGVSLPNAGWIPAGSGDFNADGKNDVVWHASDGQTVAWSVSGSSVQSITLPNVGWDLVGVADFNGDGHDDLLFKGGNSGNYSIYYMNGSTQIGGVSYSNGWNFAGVGDFNGDGKTDVLMTDGHGNYGAISTNGSSIGGYTLPSNGWDLIAIGDFNGDHTSDLILRGGNGGDTQIGYMKNGSWNGSYDLGNRSGTVVAVGDFDGDGRQDLLWTDGAGHYSITFLTGSGAHDANEGAVGTEWSVAGTGDYNGDGKADILWHNASTSQNAVWYMNGASYDGQQYASSGNTTITLLPVTTVSNGQGSSAQLVGVEAGELTSSNLTSALTLSVSQAVANGTALGQIAAASGLVIADTAANVAANLAAVGVLPHLGAITLTDVGTPSLTLSTAQLAANASVLGKISNSSYNVIVSDTAANVSASIGLLSATSHLSSVTLADHAALTLTAAQLSANGAVLGKISNAGYGIAIVDTAANVSAALAALNGNPKLSSITLTDAGMPTLTLTSAQVASDTLALSKVTNATFNIAFSDTGAVLTAKAGTVTSGAGAGDSWLKLFNPDGTLASSTYNDPTGATSTSYTETFNHGVAANQTATITSGADAGNTYIGTFGPTGAYASWTETDVKNLYWWSTYNVSYYGDGNQAVGILTADTGDVQVNVYNGAASASIINTGTRLAHPTSSSGLIVASGYQYTNYYNGSVLNWQTGQWTTGQNNGDTWINTYNSSGGLVSQQVFDNNHLLGASYTLYFNAAGVQISEFGTYDSGSDSAHSGDTYSMTFNANGSLSSYTLNDITGRVGCAFTDGYNSSGRLLSRSGIYDSGGIAGDSFQFTYNPDGSVASYSMSGNAANNILSPQSTSAVMTGGGGYDRYQFGPGSGQERIINGTGNSGSPQGELDLTGGVSNEQIWFVRSGNDLLVDILGTHDQATIANWFGASPDARLAQIVTSDGHVLDNQVNQLVQAMATYSASNPAFNPVTASQAPSDATLQAAIAAAWHT
ncbi:FG-GAP-like repeat-containing protein [Bradyrhizobium sp. SZCCHNRI3037]|uniref:FG-GAP-like repeat-containing protein n=1 Tax=Bradyrhizobium sp. SZCCHNRI3037 TaxID=3057290 RepID=UPI002916DAA0|nr:FG-GAP-like repeat-containing protein [Bradyrhizobium sp. SZCCHNRI3037]